MVALPVLVRQHARSRGKAIALGPGDAVRPVRGKAEDGTADPLTCTNAASLAGRVFRLGGQV